MFKIRSTLYHNWISWLLVSLLVIIVAGCNIKDTVKDTVVDPLADRSFLTQQPCTSPCWYGLEPGKSSIDDVYATLNKLPFVDPASISESGYIWLGDNTAKEIDFSCLHPKNTKCDGILNVAQGRLERITLNPPYPVTFQEAVDALNQPDRMNYQPFSPEGGGCFIVLVWSQKGVYVTSVEPKDSSKCQRIKDTGHIDPNIVITQIAYVAPKLLAPESKVFFPYTIPWLGFATQ